MSLMKVLHYPATHFERLWRKQEAQKSFWSDCVGGSAPIPGVHDVVCDHKGWQSMGGLRYNHLGNFPSVRFGGDLVRF